jgi:hypothetical protein
MWINQLSKDLIYLFPKEENYHKDIFGSQLLLRLIEGLKIHFALRLNIFLDETEHFNLVSFIRRLLLEHKKAEWNKHITKIELQKFESDITTIIDSVEFKTIKYIRNKVYAHNDKKAEETDLETTQDAVMIKVEKLKTIMQEIGSKVFGTNYQMDFMYWDVDHNIISTLSNYNEVYDQYIKLKYNDETEKNIKLTELEKWITKY